MGTSTRRLLLDSLILGVVGALGAQVFMFLLRFSKRVLLVAIAGYVPPGLPSEGGHLAAQMPSHGLWWIPVVTTLGGLLSGLLVYGLAPEAEGHGTDTAVRSYHRKAGFIRTRVSPLKMVASAITIGSGGAAGREGPIALISAGFGSTYATWLKRSDEERRLLVLIGMAAGLSAIFRSPIGCAIFGVEVLYGTMDLEAGALLFALLASVVAYAVNGAFVGYEPLFRVPAGLKATHLMDYGAYAALGASAGVVATAVPEVFYGLRDAFKRIPGPDALRPAIGGLLLGVLGMALPQVLGGGYGWIQHAIDGRIALFLLVELIGAKLLAFAFTVSSGGSGGVFAPTLYVGAVLGGAIAQIFHQPSAAFAVVGMAAVFGGAARVPISTILMVTEMTGGYGLLAPAALAVTVSTLLQRPLTSALRFRYPSLYEAQVPDRAHSPAHRVEEISNALRLIGEGRPSVPRSVGHLDLLALLQSGIPVSLADGRRLVLRTLESGSPGVFASLARMPFGESDETVEVVGVLRGERFLLPEPSLVLRPGDGVLAVASPRGVDRLRSATAAPGREAGREGRGSAALEASQTGEGPGEPGSSEQTERGGEPRER